MFRLTIAMATGIFLSDTLWSDKSFSCLCLLFPFIFLLTVGLMSLRVEYRTRWLFGATVYGSVACLGAVLLIYARQQVRFDWPDGESMYIGYVVNVPRANGKTMEALVKVEQVCYADSVGWKSVNRKVLFRWMPDSLQESLLCGDRFCCRAVIHRPVTDRILSAFDYGLYLERQGISGTGISFAGNWIKLSGNSPGSFRRTALLWREDVLDIFRSWELAPDVLAVVSALAVGDKSGLTPELKAAYAASGTSHVLALSGLHVGILAILLSWLLWPLNRIRGGKWVISSCLLSFLWCFAFLSGLSPSVVRAVLMFSLYSVAPVFTESRYSGFYAMSLAAFVMLIYNPLYLFDISFQLSFAAVLSIIFFYPRIERFWNVKNKLFRYLWQTAALSCAAQLGTLPLILYYFGTFPTYFLIANLVVAPLAVCILAGIVLSLCFYPMPVIGAWLVEAVGWLVSLLNQVMQAICLWEGAQISSLSLSAGQSLMAAVILLCFYAYWVTRKYRMLFCSVLVSNVLLCSFLYDEIQPRERMIHFSRGNIYECLGKKKGRLEIPSFCPVNIDTLCILRLDERLPSFKEPRYRPNVHLMYLNRGFRGRIADLARLFCLYTVVLDNDMPGWQREQLRKECVSLKIECIDLKEKGSYTILL